MQERDALTRDEPEAEGEALSNIPVVEVMSLAVFEIIEGGGEEGLVSIARLSDAALPGVSRVSFDFSGTRSSLSFQELPPACLVTGTCSKPLRRRGKSLYKCPTLWHLRKKYGMTS